MESKVKSFLDRRHPGWDEVNDHRAFLIDTFEGGPGWMARNIQKFHKEGPEEFKNRIARAYRDNISRDVVEVFTAHLFKAGVNRDTNGAPQPILDFLGKSTIGYNAMDFDSFMRTVADKTSTVSPCYIVADVPEVPEEYAGKTLTQADANAIGLKPYVYVVYPTDFLDAGVDADGEYIWCLIRETFRDDANPFAKEAPTEERFRLWTRDGWQLFRRIDKEPGYELIAEGSHPCGKVPVRRVVHKEGPDIFRAIGLIDEIAYKDRAIANNESRLDCIICDQTFSTLWIPDAGLIASTEKDAKGKRKRLIQAATNRAALFNDKAQHQPFYLSPDAAQAGVIVDLIARLRGEIWEDALLGSESKNKSTGPKTATEAEYDFEKLNGALGDKAANLESAERAILELVALWNGITLSEDQLAKLSTYPRKFQVQAIVDAVTELIGFKEFSQLGKTFWTLALDRIIDRYLPEATEEEREAMREEIETNMGLTDLLMTAPLINDGIAPPPPGSNLPEDSQEE